MHEPDSQVACKRAVVAIPVLLLGGTEIQTLALVNALVRRYDVTVCCYHEHDAGMVARFEATGARVLLLDRARAAGLPGLLRQLVRVFKGLQPDFVHVQYITPGLVPVIAARIARARAVIATVHTAGRAAYRAKAKLLLRIASWLCDAFLCVSQGVEEFWFGSSMLSGTDGIPDGRRHLTVYNCVSTDEIDATARRVGPELRTRLGVERRLTIGFVGRLTSQKGLSVLLDAMPFVVSGVPEATLLVVGTGSEEEALRRKAAALGIEEHVVWLGQRQPEEVHGLYGTMDVLAFPSLVEGFGLVAAEAMAAGVPVVASNLEGIREVVEDGVTGLLVPPGGTAALASGISALLLDGDRRTAMGEAGRTRVAAHFSRQRFEATVVALYRSLERTGRSPK